MEYGIIAIALIVIFIQQMIIKGLKLLDREKVDKANDTIMNLTWERDMLKLDLEAKEQEFIESLH